MKYDLSKDGDYFMANSMDRSYFWEADSHSTGQEIPYFYRIQRYINVY